MTVTSDALQAGGCSSWPQPYPPVLLIYACDWGKSRHDRPKSQVDAGDKQIKCERIPSD